MALYTEDDYRAFAKNDLLKFIESQPGLSATGGAGNLAAIERSQNNIAGNLKAIYEAFVDIERHADTGSY